MSVQTSQHRANPEYLKTFRNWRFLLYLWQVRALLVVERFPHDPLLDPPETLVVLRARQPAARHHQKTKEQRKTELGAAVFPQPETHHFPFGVHAHGDVDELLVEERHADLQAPGRGRLVGAQAVVLVQSFDLRISRVRIECQVIVIEWSVAREPTARTLRQVSLWNSSLLGAKWK